MKELCSSFPYTVTAISGVAMFEPMVTMMIGGLLLSPIMPLFFVPSAYYMLFRTRE